MAKVWLQNKSSPGEPDQEKALHYAAQMLAGTWIPNVGDPIIIRNGMVADGVHRLKAITLAKKPIDLRLQTETVTEIYHDSGVY